MKAYLEINACTDSIDARHVPSQNLCRFFKKQYIDDFCSQNYRFGNLTNYKEATLGSRTDKYEGESEFRTRNGALHGSLSTGFFYIISFSEENEHLQKNLLTKKFGDNTNPAVCYSIKDNIKLTQNIIRVWKQSCYRNEIAFFKCYKVVYTKNEVLDEGYFIEHPDLHVYQKPRCIKTGLYKLQRIHKTPLPQPQSGQPERCDPWGEIGTIHEFDCQKWLAMQCYNSLVKNPDFKRIEPDIKVNTYYIEQEYRLAFFTDRINQEEVILRTS